MGRNYRESGVTLVELLVVVVIITILAVSTRPFIIGYASEKRVEAQVADFWMQMNSIRGKVLKGGAPAIITLDITNSLYDVFIDLNNDSTGSSDEEIDSELRPNITFGTPLPLPSSYPPGVASFSIVSDSWKDGIFVENNSTLTIPSGWLYIKHDSKPSGGYCMVVRPGESEVQLFKWNGSQWYKY